MKDGLLDFGSMALATKDTAVYSQALDFGEFHADSPFTKHTIGLDTDAAVVFRTADAFNAADDVQFTIQDSADDDSFLDLVSGVNVEAPDAGIIQILNMPSHHRRYVRIKALPTSSGTLTASTVTAYIEFGANRTI